MGKHSTMVWFTSHHGVSTSNPSSRRRYLCSSTYPLAQVIGALHLKLRPLESKGSHWGSDIAVHSVADQHRQALVQRRARPVNKPRTTQGFSSKLDFAKKQATVNDPSAGSPTETLLRLLLPLNAQVWESSRATLENESSKGPVQIPH